MFYFEITKKSETNHSVTPSLRRAVRLSTNWVPYFFLNQNFFEEVLLND